MKNYQYKVFGKWTGEEVSAERIRELVTNGSLTPYDFIREEVTENGEKKWKKFMICKHGDEEFTNIREDWAKLQSVRTRLDELWKAQRDSLLSQITGTEAEAELNELRRKKNNEKLKNKLQKDCVSFWNDDVDVLIENSPSPQKILQIQIKKKIAADCLNNPEKFTLDGLSGEVSLDQAAYESKRKKIEDWLCASGFSNESGVYIFYVNEKPLYVGETALRLTKGGNWNNGTFIKRFFEGDAAHFTKEIPSDGKTWTLLCTKIRFFLPKNKSTTAGIQKINAQEMERLLILKYGLEELLNEKPGTKKSPIDDILRELESEIDGLCDDGELLKKGATHDREKEKWNKKQKELEKKLAELKKQYEVRSDSGPNDELEKDESGGDERALPHA
jgi:hypothetical protein